MRHGIVPRHEGGTVQLTTQMAGERLLIEVADDGDGSDTNVWRQSGGLGLHSVMRQLQARYATSSGFDVRTRRGHGFERASGKRENLGNLAEVHMDAGDTFVIETPGGGGYGEKP